jgi:hypothetical protein
MEHTSIKSAVTFKTKNKFANLCAVVMMMMMMMMMTMTMMMDWRLDLCFAKEMQVEVLSSAPKAGNCDASQLVTVMTKLCQRRGTVDFGHITNLATSCRVRIEREESGSLEKRSPHVVQSQGKASHSRVQCRSNPYDEQPA